MRSLSTPCLPSAVSRGAQVVHRCIVQWRYLDASKYLYFKIHHLTVYSYTTYYLYINTSVSPVGLIVRKFFNT